jgi:hypothetical protein
LHVDDLAVDVVVEQVQRDAATKRIHTELKVLKANGKSKV